MEYMEFAKSVLQGLDMATSYLLIIPNPILPAIGTGLGIIFGNSIINYVKYKNYIKDIYKVFDLLVTKQLDDFYNIECCCSRIKSRVEVSKNTLCRAINPVTLNSSPDERTQKERQSLLKDIEYIKYFITTIKDDDLYKQTIKEIKYLKGENLSVVVRYSRKIKILLEDLRNFIYHESPKSIEEFEDFNYEIFNSYPERLSFLIARINIVMCLGLIAKKYFNNFDIKAKENLKNSFKKVAEFKNRIQDKDSIFYLLKEDYSFLKTKCS